MSVKQTSFVTLKGKASEGMFITDPVEFSRVQTSNSFRVGPFALTAVCT